MALENRGPSLRLYFLFSTLFISPLAQGLHAYLFA